MTERNKKIIWIVSAAVLLVIVGLLLLLLPRGNGENSSGQSDPTTTQGETVADPLQTPETTENAGGEAQESIQPSQGDMSTEPSGTESPTESSETQQPTGSQTEPSGSGQTNATSPAAPEKGDGVSNLTTPNTPTEPAKPDTGTQTPSYPVPKANSVIIPAQNDVGVRIGEKVSLEVFYTGSKKLQYYTTCKYPEIFTVSQDGTVYGTMEGNYIVHVTDGEYTAEIYVMVSESGYNGGALCFEQTEITLEMGKGVNLTTSRDGVDWLTYSCTDTSVVDVKGNYVEAKKPGMSIVRVTNGYASAAIKVTVKPASGTGPVLQLTETAIDMYAGEDHQFVWNYTGSSTLQWETSNSNVARVDESGKLHTYRAGTAHISVTDGVQSHACTVTVTIKPGVFVETLAVSHRNGLCYEGTTKYAGDYLQIELRREPYYATDVILYESSDSSVIGIEEVDRQDHIYKLNFKKAGTATVTFRSGDGAKTLSYTFHVKAGYEFDPGDGVLTPEVYADYVNKIMEANGVIINKGVTGWLLYTHSADDGPLTFDLAVKNAYAFYHTWWWNSLGDHPDGVSLWYEYAGTNEDGSYLFKEHR